MIIDRGVLNSFRTRYAMKQEERSNFREKVELKKSGIGNVQFKQFEAKVANELVDKFNTRDLVFYFRKISIEAGKKYCIANMVKDMAIMKRLKQTYSNDDIILMIDFLFSEDNDYLDRPTVNILGSSWVNTIYKDSVDWAEGNYVPHKKRVKSGKRSTQLSEREYSKESEDVNINIGEW